jgi:hypothetical protein
VIVRPAVADDLEVIVSMAHDMKRRLAQWSPVYFRPRDGAEARHAAYLAYLVGSADHDSRVFVEAGEVVGFFAVVAQPVHRWIDDLYVDDRGRWSQVAERLVAAVPATPWVTCVSRFDEERGDALRAVGLDVVSTYWGRSLETGSAEPVAIGVPAIVRSVSAPRHTFGGTAFDPLAPGALVITDDAGGYLIGTPGMTPPLYDPGGPACVVDQVRGPDRAALVDAALASSAARGDSGMVIVCDRLDDELGRILDNRGFRAEVDLFARL